MTRSTHGLRIAALVLAIAAGFLLEAKASEHRAIADRHDAELSEAT
jgi:hypothetical protein